MVDRTAARVAPDHSGRSGDRRGRADGRARRLRRQERGGRRGRAGLSVPDDRPDAALGPRCRRHLSSTATRGGLDADHRRIRRPAPGAPPMEPLRPRHWRALPLEHDGAEEAQGRRCPDPDRADGGGAGRVRAARAGLRQRRAVGGGLRGGRRPRRTSPRAPRRRPYVGGGAGAVARTFARSPEMWIAADVRGAARISPAVPKNAPAEIVTTRISSGFIRSVAPIAIGCTMFCNRPFARMTITSMIRAVVVPFAPRASTTAKAPATNAPMNGTYAVTKVTTAIVPASGTSSSHAPRPTTTALKAATIVVPRK